MNRISAVKKAALVLGVVLMGNFAMAQSHSADKKQAEKWVKSRVWADGLAIKVYPEVNSVEFEKQYNSNKEMWTKVFQFLADKRKLDSLPPGKYPIDGNNAYASITYGPSKTFEKSRWESHRKYIDLQYVIKGEEKIGVAPVAGAKVTDPYNEAKDVAHYDSPGTYYIATPKTFFLFFPTEAHRPNILVKGYDKVKKLVIKIRYSK